MIFSSKPPAQFCYWDWNETPNCLPFPISQLNMKNIIICLFLVTVATHPSTHPKFIKLLRCVTLWGYRSAQERYSTCLQTIQSRKGHKQCVGHHYSSWAAVATTVGVFFQVYQEDSLLRKGVWLFWLTLDGVIFK